MHSLTFNMQAIAKLVFIKSFGLHWISHNSVSVVTIG